MRVPRLRPSVLGPGPGVPADATADVARRAATLMRRALRAAAVVAALAVAVPAPAQTVQAPTGRETSAESVASYPLASKMPVDPEVLVGALPNGLRYYVRPNGKPARQAELRLVVKAGSALEDPDQLGLAHFVEHMEFEGTRNFPGQTIIDFLSSLGLSIGPDANASTSYDETQYTLRVPTDVPGVLDRALMVLRDWADGATFDQSGIEHERGIVLSEWRMRLGADDRIQDEIRRVQLEGSRYADRSPIGDPGIIERAQREQLVRFYRDWYRPDLMAVIVVGDVNRNQVAQMITRHFTSLTNPSPSRPRPAFDVPNRSATRYAVVTDKETTSTVVRLSTLRPARDQGTVGGYRAIKMDRLFGDMLGARLDELAQGPNPPFLRAVADRSLFSSPRTRDEAVLQALVANDGVARGLDALMTELQRIQRFGFTAGELERAKQAQMLGSERVVAESPDRESESRADEYTRNFLEDEALPTIWQELAFHRRFDPEITLAEVNALAADWFPERDRLIVVSGPEASGASLPTQAQLAAVVRTAETKRLEPYVDAIAGRKLMDAPPARGSVVKATPRADGSITEWVLSNGATVVIQPTTLREGQILFRANAPGGTSLASDADFLSARIADTVIPASGVGDFSAVALDRLLNGRAVAVRPFIDEIRQGMSGGSTPQDLETMFQLIYLYFTQSRADATAFAAMKSQALALLANQLASPDVVFEQTLEATLSQGNPRRQPETPSTAQQWNLEKAHAFYKARFADASNFTFVFVGNFTQESIRPLVETYIASLPATQAKETWRDLKITPPAGIVEKTIEKGIAPKSSVAIVFSGPFEYDDANRMAMRAMVLVLQSRLSDTIRQELGGTYSITASPDMDKFPTPTYSVRIDWTCDPARTASLVERVLEEVALVRGTLLAPDRMVRVKDVLLRELERNTQDNGFLLNEIARRYNDGDGANVQSLQTMREQLAALSGYALQQAAQTYLNTDRYVQVTLVPEK